MDWRRGAEKTVEISFFPLLGAITVFAASGVTTAIHNRSIAYRTRYTITLLFSTIGFALDIGLMSVLYFNTDSASALVWPTAAGYLILPQIGAVLGSRLSRRDISPTGATELRNQDGAMQPRVSILPPTLSVVAKHDGSAVPVFVFGGTF